MADCPEKSVLVTYLYGEDSGRERARLEAHFAACRDCSEELASLRSVQVALSAWTVPEIDRGFDRWRTVAQPASSAARETWKRWSFWPARPLPLAWSLGAAATLCLAVGATAAAIAGFEVRYGDLAFSVGRPEMPGGTVPAFARADSPPPVVLPVADVAGVTGSDAVLRAGRRETDIVLSPPGDAFGSGLEFVLVGRDQLSPSDPAAMLERLTVFTPESSAALLDEIRRRMAGRGLAPEPAWADIVQRLRLAQERNPARVREDFADFVVRVAAPPGDARPAAAGRR